MPRKAAELTDVAIRNLRKPGLHFVGQVPGLALQVLPERRDAAGRRTQAKTWVLRVTIGGKRRDMGFGGYPEVSLKDARNAARAAREKIRSGLDPIQERHAARMNLRAAEARERASEIASFRKAAREYIAAHESSWRNPKHRAQWASTLKAYAYPVIGDLAVQDVDLGHVRRILEPIWKEKTETATRLRGRIEAILDRAKAVDVGQNHPAFPVHWQNPARWRGHLDKILARPSRIAKVEHHEALPFSQATAFMAELRKVGGQGARALEFAVLTAARSGEVRGARWSEIDLNEKVWTIPAARMKAGREHRIPLSTQAMDLLTRAPRIAGTDLVFPAPRGGQLSDMTLSAVLRRMNVSAVPHGFRSTFRDWAAERTSCPHEVCEMALAHVIGNKAEAAYRRGDLFEKRRHLMGDWATYLSSAEAMGQVHAMRGGAT